MSIENIFPTHRKDKQENLSETKINSSNEAVLSFEETSEEAILLREAESLPDELLENSQKDSLLNRVVSGVYESVNKAGDSLENIWLTAQHKLVDSLPDYLIKVIRDKYVDQYRSLVKDSVDKSRAGALMYSTMAKKRRFEPLQEYGGQEHLSALSDSTERTLDILDPDKLLFSKLHILKSLRNLESDRFNGRNDKLAEWPDKDGGRIQVLNQSFIDKHGVNTLQEGISNFIYDDGTNNQWNYCDTSLVIHNQPSKKSIDLGVLLPAGYRFCPSDMDVEIIKKTEQKSVETGNDEYLYKYKELKNYSGLDKNRGRFYVRGHATVCYGDLLESGGTLSLLHEIAHAWHTKYRDIYANGEFDNFYKNISEALSEYDLYRLILDKFDKKVYSTDKPNMKAESSDHEDMKALIIEKLREKENFLREQDCEILSDQEKDDVTSDVYSVPLFDKIKIKTERLKPLIAEYVASERDAWAHAIRILRFFRQEGIDLEPGLKTPEDIVEVAHKALLTYQKLLEFHLNVPSNIKKFVNQKIAK